MLFFASKLIQKLPNFGTVFKNKKAPYFLTANVRRSISSVDIYYSICWLFSLQISQIHDNSGDLFVTTSLES